MLHTITEYRSEIRRYPATGNEEGSTLQFKIFRVFGRFG
jgi:hypothetical protein